MSKILAIDDKLDNLITISAILKTLIPGCNVITARSGPEGIQKAKTESPDTILLDIRMPEMDGYEVCTILKKDELTKHIPVIMVSAILTESRDRVRGLKTGADAYLLKPIDEYVLVAQVQTALRIKKAEDLLRKDKDALEEMVRQRTAELTAANKQLKSEIKEHRKSEEEKKILEMQLRQAQKMEAIGTLAGGIAHDFNNILFPIMGYAEMMLDDTPEDSPLQDMIKGILHGAMRAKDLVWQILAFSRQSDKELKPLKAQLIIKEVLKLSRSTLPASIEIRQNIHNDCGMIMADPTQIHQIAMNLITNAFHAMENSGGVLTIDLQNIDIDSYNIQPGSDLSPVPYVCLTVSDTGAGMDDILIEKIFDPYFTTKEKYKGTGLGLSVVHGIVTSYNGTIKVESESGKGTSFYIYIPQIVSRVENKVKNIASALPTGDERILLVDDEQSVAKIIKLNLERLGYEVDTYNSSLDALNVFRETPKNFDLVLTDMTMPDMSGDVLARELKKIRPDIPIILCTGFSEKIEHTDMSSLGVDNLLMKPIEKDELANTVRKVLDR